MSAAQFRQSVTIPAVPEQVREARAFVARMLGESHVHADLALLLSSELVTNSVRHSGSAAPGGVVTVTVAATGEAEGSRGLWLVDALSARWGYERGGGFATTWFEIQALLQPMQHSAVSGKGLNPPDVEVSGLWHAVISGC